jgi:hypothetical protein
MSQQLPDLQPPTWQYVPGTCQMARGHSTRWRILRGPGVGLRCGRGTVGHPPGPSPRCLGARLASVAGISVGHEGLRFVKRFLESSTSQPEAFACLSDRPTSTPTGTSLDITASRRRRRARQHHLRVTQACAFTASVCDHQHTRRPARNPWRPVPQSRRPRTPSPPRRCP